MSRRPWRPGRTGAPCSGRVFRTDCLIVRPRLFAGASLFSCINLSLFYPQVNFSSHQVTGAFSSSGGSRLTVHCAMQYIKWGNDCQSPGRETNNNRLRIMPSGCQDHRCLPTHRAVARCLAGCADTLTPSETNQTFSTTLQALRQDPDQGRAKGGYQRISRTPPGKSRTRRPPNKPHRSGKPAKAQN